MRDAERLLARYRATVEPTASELERVRLAVSDPDARFRIVRRPRRAPARARAGRYAVAGALLAVLAAAALLWWIASPGRPTAVVGSDAPSQAPDRSASSTVEGDAPSRAAMPPPSRAPTSDAAAPEMSRPLDDAPIAPPAAHEPKARESRTRTAAPVREDDARDALERETVLIQRAEAALRRDDPEAALALTDAHARDFPDGVLVVERRAVRAIALCMKGDAAQGRSEATKLQRVPASAPYRERIRRACEGT